MIVLIEMKLIIKQIYKNSRFNNSETMKLIVDSFSEYFSIRSGVADNPSTPSSTLDYLSKDKDEYVRIGVAWNPNTPISTLKFLSKDKNELLCVYSMGHQPFCISNILAVNALSNRLYDNLLRPVYLHFDEIVRGKEASSRRRSNT